jgi:hypothetical protein
LQSYRQQPCWTANLIAVSGEGQFALPGAAVPESLAVQAVDDQNVGVAGVAITWTVVTGGGIIAPAAASSDANGRLAARWILGSLGAQRGDRKGRTVQP